MARRVTGAARAARSTSGRRRLAWVGVVVAVMLVHGVVTRELAARMSDFELAPAMPERVAVTYVRTIEPTAPPPIAARALPPPAKRSPRAPRQVAHAASAAEAPASASEVAAAAPPASDAAVVPDEVIAAAASATLEPAPSASAVVAAQPASAEPASAPVVAEGDPEAPAFEWPASTRVSYALTGNYRGEVRGQAQVEWIHLDDRYQVNLDLIVGPEFAPLITRRMTSEGRIAASGLVPSRYDEDTQVVFRDRRRVSVTFEPAAVVLANGERRERLDGVQDTASQFIQLIYLFSTRPGLLRVGSTVGFPLALPRTMDRYAYDVVDEQPLSTSFGTLQAFHLEPRPRGVKKSNELSVEMWIAPELRYLPVRIRIEQDPSTFIDLMISKKPEIAAAPAVASASSGKTP